MGEVDLACFMLRKNQVRESRNLPVTLLFQYHILTFVSCWVSECVLSLQIVLMSQIKFAIQLMFSVVLFFYACLSLLSVCAFIDSGAYFASGWPQKHEIIRLPLFMGLPIILANSTTTNLHKISTTASFNHPRSTSRVRSTLLTHTSSIASSIRSVALVPVFSEVGSASTLRTTLIRVASSASAPLGLSSVRSVSTLRTIFTSHTSTIRPLSTAHSTPSSVKLSTTRTITSSAASSLHPTRTSNATDLNPPQIPPNGSGSVCGGSPNGCWAI